MIDFLKKALDFFGDALGWLIKGLALVCKDILSVGYIVTAAVVTVVLAFFPDLQQILVDVFGSLRVPDFSIPRAIMDFMPSGFSYCLQEAIPWMAVQDFFSVFVQTVVVCLGFRASCWVIRFLLAVI